MVLEEGIRNRGLNFLQMAKFFSTNAARRFGLYPKKGVIRTGADADFILVDMDRPWIHTRKNSFSKTRETGFPYEGRRIRCFVEATIVRGKIVYRRAKLRRKLVMAG